MKSSSDKGSMIRTAMTTIVPKNLTHQQIVSVVEAAKTAPTLSGTVLRRNLMDHNSPTKTIPVQLKRCVQRRVYSVRKELTK